MVGPKVLEVHYALRTEIPQIVQRYFKVTTDVLRLFDTVFADLLTEKLTSSGREHVFEFATDNLSELYKILSDDARMAQEIRALTNTEEMRSVVIDNASYFANLTLISQKFVIPYRGLGTLTVIGPVEQDYQKTLSRLDLLAKVLSMKLMDYYRYLDGNHYEIS